MRDPARIEPFLNELKELWLKWPDMRFGQLVLALYGPMRIYGDDGGDAFVDARDTAKLYSMEEFDWLKRIKEFK